MDKPKVLLFGHSGWIGSKIAKILEPFYNVIAAESRLNNPKWVIEEIENVQPNHVINCAGLTGRPNIDWCEDHRTEVMEVNTLGAATIANTCAHLNIHHIYMGTGCIYSYDYSHLMPGFLDNGDKCDLSHINGYKERDEPNFTKSFYSHSKVLTEKILKEYDNTLILRIRMPISDDLHEQNFITKITKYERVVNIPNSMSILYDLLPLVKQMLQRKLTGILNLTNPGVISHNQILSLYKQYIDEKFEWTNFTLEEQDKVIKAPRSNNYLNTNKLERLFPEVRPITESIVDVFKRMRINLNKE
jgi:dTDP-4-dehydrorhamnose reductase